MSQIPNSPIFFDNDDNHNENHLYPKISSDLSFLYV